MHVKISNESFGQSAKILSRLIDESFGAQGRGGLAQARQMLAKTLKFESSHAIEAYFSRPDNDGAAQPASLPDNGPSKVARRGFGDLSLEERGHALGTLALLDMDGGREPWARRAAGLIALLVEVEASELGGWMGKGSFLRRMRQGLSIRLMREALRSMPSAQEHSLSARMHQHISLMETSAGLEDLANAQNANLQERIEKVLDKAEKIEERGRQLLVPALAMRLLDVYGASSRDSLVVEGHWLEERRFHRIASKIAKRAERAQMAPQALDVWGFAMEALSTPIESDRLAAMSCLTDIVGLPASHCKQAYDDFALIVEREVGSVLAEAEAKGKIAPSI